MTYKKSYAGLALTGPKDGKFVRAETDTMRAVVPTHAPLSFESEPSAAAAVETVVYKHVDFHYAENYPNSSVRARDTHYGFWVPFDTQSPHEFIIKTLASAYVGRAK